MIRKDWDDATIAMADKLTNERSQLSDSIGLHLQEIYLGDELTTDFIEHGEYVVKETNDGSHDEAPTNMLAEHDSEGTADDLCMVDVRATVIRLVVVVVHSNSNSLILILMLMLILILILTLILILIGNTPLNPRGSGRLHCDYFFSKTSDSELGSSVSEKEKR